MDLEQQLRESYEDHLGSLEMSGGDPVAARRTGRRMRARRRLTVATAALAVLAAGVVHALVSGHPDAAGPADGSGHWRELPSPPISPRADALAVWTGDEVLVLGGDAHPCPAGASCTRQSHELRQGAAYDPVADTWRPLPPLPVPVGPGDRLVVADHIVVLRHSLPHGSSWFTYEPDHNRWLPIPDVPRGVGDLPSALGPRVYVTAGRRVAVYDVTRFRWTLLPPDTQRPALAQRTVTATSAGVVVTGVDASKPNDGRTPSLQLADVWDGHRWRRLPPSRQLAGRAWSWTGSRMVEPEPFTQDGGAVDGWGRSYPMGGTLDPATGTWGPLPAPLVNPPSGDTRGADVFASGGTWFAVDGQAYDDATGRIYRLQAPGALSNVSGVWADGRLLVFGGAAFHGGGTQLSKRAWLWTP